MILCVSDVSWSGGGESEEDEVMKEGVPQVEVTDGWYRLRVQLDEPLCRAVARGLIKVGRKLAVSGAYVGDKQDHNGKYN